MMRQFLKNIVAFCLLFAAFQLCVNQFAPYYSGSNIYSTKIQYLETLDKSDRPDLVFFGSSRTARHIDPLTVDHVIDSITGLDITSFNLGSQATFALEYHRIFDGFLTSDAGSAMQYTVIELGPVMYRRTHQHLDQSSYWRQLRHLRPARPLTNLYALKIWVRYQCIPFFENTINFGHFGRAFISGKDRWARCLGESKRGYLPLDEEIKILLDGVSRKSKLERRQHLWQQPALLDKRVEEIRRARNAATTSIDQIYLQEHFDIIEKARIHGVHVIFVMPPRYSGKTVNQIYDALPPDNKIDLGDPDAYPALYTLENSFDIGHLNSNGAQLFSKIMGQALAERMTPD